MTSRSLVASLLFLSAACTSCKDDKPRSDTPPPPPPPVAPAAGACSSGGGDLTDAVSAPFFAKSAGGYCVDPQGEIKTYGEKGKLSMDEVCTTAFDGECEVYKRFGLKRVVSLHYVDGSGKGGTVEVNLSQFGDVPGAYGMFTLRVVAGDPAEPSTPKPLAAGAAAAIGTGRAYVWRGQHLAELQYVNENESPEQLAKSSEAILTTVGKEIGDRLPGPTTLPPAAQLLPVDKRVANGVVFHPKDVLGWPATGPGAVGYYKDGDRRWRVLSIVKDDADQAKDAFKTIKSKPGTLPVAATGDEAAHVVVPSAGEDKASAPKVEMLVARKGNVVWGVADEEYALRAASGPDRDKARLSKEEAVAKMKELLASPAPSAAADGGAAEAPAGAGPKPAPSAAPDGAAPTK
ncbi:MAG: hypothetical protein KIS78_17145 [Labilithrix sp.]|nr:hypothetical protein [Labilithrix sp.]MCW5834128.1 hypothetical protein [Labilithrix sp.]